MLPLPSASPRQSLRDLHKPYIRCSTKVTTTHLVTHLASHLHVAQAKLQLLVVPPGTGMSVLLPRDTSLRRIYHTVWHGVGDLALYYRLAA